MYCNCRAIIERDGSGGREILIQVRNKPYEGGTGLELPGGRVEEFESLVEALRREVREETGLDLSFIEGEQTRIETRALQTSVECLPPFAVYQTLRGPVDSVGAYFLCHAKGQLQDTGDESSQPRWMSVSEIARLLGNDSERFSFVDRAGLTYYLRNRPNDG